MSYELDASLIYHTLECSILNILFWMRHQKLSNLIQNQLKEYL
jgi:hypothetical protein